MNEVTAAKLRQRNRRKRIQISQIEKTIAIKQLLENQNLQYAPFRERYVSNTALVPNAKKSSIKVKSTEPSYRCERLFGYLRNIPSKSLAWKFMIAVDFMEAENQGLEERIKHMLHELAKLSVRSQAGMRTMETRFVDPQRLDRYDDQFKQRVSTKARL